MSKPFAAATKQLFEADPLAWLHYDELSGTRTRLIETELTTVAGEVDKVLRVQTKSPYLAHFEFEATYRKRQGRRILRWNSLLHTGQGLPVRSVLVLLRPQADGPAITGTAGYSFDDGPERLDFRYRVIRVWQNSADEVLEGSLATLPLAPLTDIEPGDLPGVLRRMERRIQREAPPDDAGRLWTATYLLMGLTYERAMIDQLLKGVRGMKESVTYQAILEEGESIGLKKGELAQARRMVFRLGARRLGPPDARTRAAIESVSSLPRLERLLAQALQADDWSQLRKAAARRNGVRRRARAAS